MQTYKRRREHNILSEMEEIFRCKDNCVTKIPIQMFRPLFEAFDEMFFMTGDQRVFGGIIFTFLRTIRTDFHRISRELGKDPMNAENTNGRSAGIQYDCIKRLVFSSDGVECYVELDRFKKFVNIPDDDVTADTVSALMALVLWKSAGDLSRRVQRLQQSIHPRVRDTTSKFMDLLKPFARSATQMFQEHETPLYSIRKRCTATQITDLKQRLACNEQVDTTSTSIICASTSLEFCKKYQSIDSGYKSYPLMLMFTVESRDIPIFVPLMYFVKDLGNDHTCREYEVLILPGAKMQFRNIRSTTTANVETMVVDVKIVGTDTTHRYTQPLIASRVPVMDTHMDTQTPQQLSTDIAHHIMLAISDLSMVH